MSADVQPVEYEVAHTTEYDYSLPVAVSHHLACLAPRVLPRQKVLRHDLEIEPRPAAISTHTDYFGNAVTFFAMEGPHQRLTVRARSQVTLEAASLPEPADTPPWESVADRNALPLEAMEFSFDSSLSPADRRTGRLRARVLSGGQAAARGGPRSDAPDPRRVHLRSGGDHRQDAARGGLQVAARRVSGLRAGSRSRACGRSGCRRGTSAGISRRFLRPAARACSAPTRHTPGWRSTVRGPVGSTSTPPTTCCHPAGT